MGEFYGFGVFLSGFDVGKVATARNEMQYRQNCTCGAVGSC